MRNIWNNFPYIWSLLIQKKLEAGHFIWCSLVTKNMLVLIVILFWSDCLDCYLKMKGKMGKKVQETKNCTFGSTVGSFPLQNDIYLLSVWWLSFKFGSPDSSFRKAAGWYASRTNMATAINPTFIGFKVAIELQLIIDTVAISRKWNIVERNTKPPS